MEGAQGQESSGRENSESIQSLDKSLFKIIDVPSDGSCLFWAATLAYLVPVKYDEYAFHERFSRLFGFKETQELTKIQKLIQEYPFTNYVHFDQNELLKAFVTQKFRERVIDEMSSNQNEIIQSITLDDILCSRNAEYITDGTFKTEFTDIFGSSTSVEIKKLKPSILNEDAIRIINEELEKVKDQEKLKLFKFRSYLQCMRECTAWGGHHEIIAICRVLRCNVRVFSNTTPHSFDYSNSSDQIYLFHTNRVHYKFGLIQAQKLIAAIRNPDMTQKAESYVRLGIHDIDYQDTDGWTALHFAAQSGRIEIIRALLAQRASTEIINNRNKIPIQTAMFCATEVNGPNSHMKIAVILLDEKQPGYNLREDEKKILSDYIEQYQRGLSADQPKSQREQESQSSENGLVSEKYETGSPVTETMESHVSSSTGSTTDQILDGNSQQTPKDLIDDEQATIAQSENQPCAQQPRDAGVSSTLQVVKVPLEEFQKDPLLDRKNGTSLKNEDHLGMVGVTAASFQKEYNDVNLKNNNGSGNIEIGGKTSPNSNPELDKSDNEAGLPDMLMVPSNNNVNLEAPWFNKAIICFKIETLEGTDISRIVMKCNEEKFDRIVKLDSHEKEMPSHPISEVIPELLQYLKRFRKPCILVAYQCNDIDGPLLAWQIKNAALAEKFSQITTFVDIQQLFREKYPNQNGRYTFKNSVKEILKSSAAKKVVKAANDASEYVDWFQKLVNRGFTNEKIFQAAKSFDFMLQRAVPARRTAEVMETLKPLKKVVSEGMLKRLAEAGITYDLLKTKYREGEGKAIDLLEAKVAGKAQLIKKSNILDKILEHLKASQNI